MIVNQYPNEDTGLLSSLWSYLKMSGNQGLYNQVNKHLDMLVMHGLEMNKEFKKIRLNV
jgi:hypothetical protein